MFKKIGLLSIIIISLGIGQIAFAHLPRIVKEDKVVVHNPEISQAFYGELSGGPAEYDISSAVDFNLYINLLVPKSSNKDGRYSANIFQIKDGKEELVAFVDGTKDPWQEIWEEYGRDSYIKGPEFEKDLLVGDYKIMISGNESKGKYVLAIGKKEQFTWQEILNVYYVLPLLKVQFFGTSVFEFLKTPFVLFGAMALVIVFIIIDLIIYLIGKAVKRSRPKSILD